MGELKGPMLREKAAMTGEVKSGADESPFSIGLRRRRGLLPRRYPGKLSPSCVKAKRNGKAKKCKF